MTCIIGCEHKGTVYMGSDSALSDGWTICSLAGREKVFKRDDFLIGCCGSARMMQLLHYALHIPERVPSKRDMEYLVIDFVDAVRETLETKGTLFKDVDNGVQYLPFGSFLLGYKGKLYSVESDMQVSRSMLGFAAVGSGAETAMGAMYAMQSNPNLSPDERIRKALDAASMLTTFVQPPFHVIKIAGDDSEEDDDEDDSLDAEDDEVHGGEEETEE